MEYLVTMTTQVPEGTAEEVVADIRAREAAHSQELATQGQLLRLWRPPLRPGEWRTLGLFAADDDRHLEQILASMPLRIWRTDEVLPLSPQPNDPSPTRSRPGSPEFFTWFTINFPAGTSSETVDEVTARQAQQARQLADQGHLLRLWALPAEPGHSRVLGLWQAQEATEMDAILQSLPVGPWATVEITPLSPHPSDPGRIRER